MKLFKSKKKNSFAPENHISVVSERQQKQLDTWISNNPPKFPKLVFVKIIPFYGSDFWGQWCDLHPEGEYAVIGVLKMEVEMDDHAYRWKYVVKKGGTEYYEIAEEQWMTLSNKQ